MHERLIDSSFSVPVNALAVENSSQNSAFKKINIKERNSKKLNNS